MPTKSRRGHDAAQARRHAAETGAHAEYRAALRDALIAHVPHNLIDSVAGGDGIELWVRGGTVQIYAIDGEWAVGADVYVFDQRMVVQRRASLHGLPARALATTIAALVAA